MEGAAYSPSIPTTRRDTRPLARSSATLRSYCSSWDSRIYRSPPIGVHVRRRQHARDLARSSTLRWPMRNYSFLRDARPTVQAIAGPRAALAPDVRAKVVGLLGD